MSEKTVNDNLYGRIPVTALEASLLGTPAFLRLGHISQLGLAPMVFPAATHTRFSHSLGVMHLTGRVAEALQLPEREIATLRVAGLLHDIGQYPLSHCIESVYRMVADTATQQALVVDTGAGSPATPAAELQQVGVRRNTGGREADDKHMGAALLRKRADLRDAFKGYSVDPDEVAIIVEGNPGNPLYQAILNSDYDCDRLDYVQRDSLMTGVPYGKVDLDYLIENMVARPFPAGSTDNVLAIIRRKGLSALEHYILSRYYMYSQVYFHKTVRSFELLAKAVFLHLAQRNQVYSDRASILAASDDDFNDFHDGYFYEHLRAYARSDTPDQRVGSWISRLLSRQPLSMVFEHRELATDERKSEHRHVRGVLTEPSILRGIAERAGVDPGDIILDIVPRIDLVPLRSDVPNFQDVLTLVERVRDDPAQSGPTVKAPWVYDDQSDRLSLLAEDPGSILTPLMDMGISILRVYTTNDTRAAALQTEIAAAVAR
jgi:HD superfamily phosphohydrolase